MLDIINKYYIIMVIMKNLIYYIANKVHSPNVNQQITKELYAFTMKTILTLLILSTFFLSIFWNQIEQKSILVTWYIVILALNALRFYDYLRYQKISKEYDPIWYHRFQYKVVLNAILWGILPLLFLKDINNDYQLIMILVLIGLTGGVIGFIFDFKTSLLFITIVLLPLFITLFFIPIEHGYILQTLIFILYILLVVSSKHLNELFYQTYENQEKYHWTHDMLREKSNKLSALLEQAPIGIFYYDKNLKILSYNKVFYRIFGLKSNLSGFSLLNLQDKKAVNIMRNVLKSKSSKEYLGSYNFSFHEKTLWAELTCSALLDDEGEIVGGIGTVVDKTTEHQAYEKINYISLHDSLTKLPNRRSYKDFMLNLIGAKEHQHKYSLLFYMDLNHFKQINDTFGHHVGDQLLLQVAQRFESLDVKEKHLSRLGGDEFTFVFPFIASNEDESYEKANIIAQQIKALFKPLFEIEGLNLYMTSSIGIVIIQPQVNDIDTIIRKADMAMYQTKREGQDNINFYDHSLDLKQQALTALQHDLNHAIESNQLKLYYQPIVNIKDNQLNSVEALIRWQHPTKGLIMPDDFIPMATESGLVNKIGWWVIKEVAQQLALWQKYACINFEYVSVNINTRQLNEVDFCTTLDYYVQHYGINPTYLKLDLTETTLIHNFSKTQKIIQNLKEKGIECNIDDFGTGYSSLSFLKKLSFKVLKIDRLFITNIVNNQDDQELVKSIIDIGKQFNYKIIIEGIETEEQKNKLISLDANIYYQGYLCSQPIPAKEFEKEFLFL